MGQQVKDANGKLGILITEAQQRCISSIEVHLIQQAYQLTHPILTRRNTKLFKFPKSTERRNRRNQT